MFEDLNADGVQNPFDGELGLAGWTVELWWNGKMVASATTDDMGKYQIPGLGNTTYSVCLGTTTGYNQTYPVAGMPDVSACGSAGALGYTFLFQGSFQQSFPGIFGMQLQ